MNADVLLLALAPVTGRTHQLRVHASHAGLPLLGDRDYGGLASVTCPSGQIVRPGRVALHAARVVVPGEDGQPIEITSPPPAELSNAWVSLGGAHTAWENASRCPLAPPSR